MKKYKVVLSKSYLVTVKAENAEKAQRYAEFYTSDSKDLSTPAERAKHHFRIEEIECTVNDAIDKEANNLTVSAQQLLSDKKFLPYLEKYLDLDREQSEWENYE